MTPRDDERRKFEAWWNSYKALDALRAGKAHEFAWLVWLARAEQAETTRAAEPTCKQCGFKQTDAIHFDPKYEFRHYYIEGVYVPSPIQHTKAAAPVEDRPAPTPCKCGKGDCPTHDDDKQSVIYEEE